MNTPDKLSETLVSGKTVGGGRYILNKPVGEHSNIWQAHDDVENKPVVLNFLPSELCQDPRALEELRNTINAVRDFSHPNIGNIYELYESQGEEAFVSAEYIEGMNLRGLQQMQPNKVFSWTFLAPLLKQIFAALQYAHENGIAQGSLKPSSLMLDRKGQIKMLDVGVAGILNNPLFAGPPKVGAGGLLPYLSPQQVDGNLPAVTDDIYSLGITIYEFFTGTVPFYQGDILPQIRGTPAESMEQRLAKLRISNAIPPIFSSMVMECLSKDPATRPQNIETLAKSLEIAEMTPMQEARPMAVQRADTRGAVEVLPPDRSLAEAKPAQPARKPTMAIAIAVVATLLIGGGAAWYFLKGRGENGTEAVNRPDKKLTPEEQKMLEDEKRRQEEFAKTNQGSIIPTPEPPKVTTSTDETAEEKRLRRLAEDAKELKTLADQHSGSTANSVINLFNGKDLTGWKGDPAYWSVRDGVITVQTPENAQQSFNTCLVWQDGDVYEFELRFQFKAKIIHGSTLPYGGVVYRGHVVKGGADALGYECRLFVSGDNMGMLTSRDRMGIISFTQKTVVRDVGGFDKLYVIQELPDTPAEINKSIKRDDWNDCIITMQGNHIIHKINGKIVADLTDENDKKRYGKGILALELNTGLKPAAFIQFRDLKLKKLSSSSNASDRAGAEPGK